MRGMVAQQAIAQFPDRFQSLILSATSPAFGRPDGEFQKKFFASQIKPLDDSLTMGDLAETMVSNMMDKDPDPKGKQLELNSIFEASGDTYRASMECLVTFNRRDNLSKISVPTLLIAGEKDGNASAAMMEKMASKKGYAKDAIGFIYSMKIPANNAAKDTSDSGRP